MFGKNVLPLNELNDEITIVDGISRRQFMQCAAATLILSVTPKGFAASASSILAVRVWPAQDYTRVTFEYNAPLQFNSFTVKNPERLVVDLQGVELNQVLEGLSSKVSETDPYIKLIRAGRFKPGVVRLVLDLKTEVNPQLFTLTPVGGYGHRLVMDLYPMQPVDPLMALVNPAESKPIPSEKPASSIKSEPDESTKQATVKEEPNKEEVVQDTSPVDKNKLAITRLVTVVIDPGHGGEDPGAVGKNGTYEKNVTLAIAKKLKTIIDAQPNMRAVLTRDGDYFIPLHQRVNKARKINADLFVSIHADSFIRPDARGSSVFALSERGATSTAARWLAKRENEADLIGGVKLDVKDPYLAHTLFDLTQTATISDSLKLGKAVLSELGSVNQLHKQAVEQAGFAVLKAPDIPSILVETAFISNPEEEKRLLDDAYQHKMAQAIVSGMKRYFAKNPSLAKSKLALNQ